MTDYLAVNNTAADLDRAASFDDLFREGNSPPTNNPFISDQSYNTSNNPFSTDQSNEFKLDHSNQSNSNPFQQSTLNPFSSGTDSADIIMPTIVAPQSSANESNTGNLIDFWISISKQIKSLRVIAVPSTLCNITAYDFS